MRFSILTTYSIFILFSCYSINTMRFAIEFISIVEFHDQRFTYQPLIDKKNIYLLIIPYIAKVLIIGIPCFYISKPVTLAENMCNKCGLLLKASTTLFLVPNLYLRTNSNCCTQSIQRACRAFSLLQEFKCFRESWSVKRINYLWIK